MHQKSRTSNGVMQKLYIFNQLHTPTKVYKEIKFHNKIQKRWVQLKREKRSEWIWNKTTHLSELQFALSRDVLNNGGNIL